MRKIVQKIHFFGIRSCKKQFLDAFLGKNWFFKKIAFFICGKLIFQDFIFQALEKLFFYKIYKVQYLSFHTHFQVSKNI